MSSVIAEEPCSAPSACSPNYIDVEGMTTPGILKPEDVKEAMRYEPQSDDVFIATYPKSGTTWTQYIVGLIFRRGRPFQDMKDYLQSAPFFEMCGKSFIDNLQRPGAIKIHLPLSRLRCWSHEAKYIYVARNPKDVMVSLYHHTKSFPIFEFLDGNFDHFFELFIEGKVEFDDHLDHVMGWYEKRNEPNVLFLTFEDMKADRKKAVMDIATFLGPQYAQDLEDDPKFLEDVMWYSSFEFMKDHTNEMMGHTTEPEFTMDQLHNLDEYCQRGPPKVKATFVRKGVVGDWKGHLTPEQARRLDDKYAPRLAGTDIGKKWGW